MPRKKTAKKSNYPPLEDYSGHGANKAELAKEKRKQNKIVVRFIIKEAEYLMRCGRYTQSITTVNRVLNNLPAYGLEINEMFGETMKLHTQVRSEFQEKKVELMQFWAK